VAPLWDLAEQAAEQQHARHGRDDADDAGHGIRLAQLGEKADDVSVRAARPPSLDGGRQGRRTLGEPVARDATTAQLSLGV